jgi:hypothetical protein
LTFLSLAYAPPKFRTKTRSDYNLYESSDLYRQVISEELKVGGEVVEKREVHHSKAFAGHLDQKKN